MEINNGIAVGLFAITAVLATGCAVEVRPAYVAVPAPVVEVAAPPVEISVGVPDAYTWDGVEYVGYAGGQYVYYGPRGGWVVCDSVRLGRFHGWERGHPNWRRNATRNEGRNARGRAPARREERHEERR